MGLPTDKQLASSLSNARSFNHLAVFIFGMFFALTGFFIIFKAQAAPRPATAQVKLFLSPSSTKISAAAPFVVDVWGDSLTSSVNAVQANLSYDPTQLQLTTIDTSASPFAIAAETVGSGGVIRIARGSSTTLQGQQAVARITFKPLVSSGKTSLKFTSGSQLVDATSNLNIMTQTLAGAYRFTP
jgi:hypothetical protein